MSLKHARHALSAATALLASHLPPMTSGAQRLLEKAIALHEAREPDDRDDPDNHDHTALAHFDKALRQVGFRNCGLNGDWSVSAYHLSGGRTNQDPGELYLLDDEDDTWSVVRRWYHDDDYLGLPDEYRGDADGGNDAIVTEMSFEDSHELLRWVRKN